VFIYVRSGFELCIGDPFWTNSIRTCVNWQRQNI
jgi:hypothetical protein